MQPKAPSEQVTGWPQLRIERVEAGLSMFYRVSWDWGTPYVKDFVLTPREAEGLLEGLAKALGKQVMEEVAT